MNITVTRNRMSQGPIGTSFSKGQRSYTDTVLLSKSSDIEQAVFEFEKKREQRRIKDLQDAVSRVRSIPEQMPMDAQMFEMMEELHLPKGNLPTNLSRFNVLLKKHCIGGIGYHNENGGIVFYSNTIGGYAYIGESGFCLFSSRENRKDDTVLVFENILDYIAYRVLMSMQGKFVDGDCLVVNEFCNFVPAMLQCENYKHLLCFFHSDSESSLAMRDTFLDRLKYVTKDMSHLYSDKGFSCMLDLVASLHK